jgi:hypothetical protein
VDRELGDAHQRGDDHDAATDPEEAGEDAGTETDEREGEVQKVTSRPNRIWRGGP